MPNTTQAVTLSVRVRPEVRDNLDKLSDATGRTKSFLAAEAIEKYIDAQIWQVTETQNAVDHANSPNAKFTEHNTVKDWVNSWCADEDRMA